MKSSFNKKFHYLLWTRELFCIISLILLTVIPSEFEISYFLESDFFKSYGIMVYTVFNIFFIAANILYVIFKIYQQEYVLMRLYEKYIIIFQLLIFFMLCLLSSSLILGPILILLIFIFDFFLYQFYESKSSNTLSYESADNIPAAINLMYIKKRIPIGDDKYIEPGEVVNILDIIENGKEDSSNSEKKIKYKIQRYNGTILDISNKYL